MSRESGRPSNSEHPASPPPTREARRRLLVRPLPLAAAFLTQEEGPSHCSAHAEAKKVPRDRQDAGLTRRTARNLNPNLASRQRKCLALHTVPELHFPESPRGSAWFPRTPVLHFPECSSRASRRWARVLSRDCSLRVTPQAPLTVRFA